MLVTAMAVATGCAASATTQPSASAQAPSPATSATTTTADTAPAAFERYTVVRGDTLIAISNRYGLHLNDITKANNIADPTMIFPGQVLLIPPPADERDRPLLTIAPPTDPSLPRVLPTTTTSTSLPPDLDPGRLIPSPPGP